MQNEFTFKVDLCRTGDTPLGIDLILAKTKLDGSLLVVEKVRPGGLIEEWNRKSVGPYRVQAGDLIASANGVQDDANAISNLLRNAQDTLRITVLRKQLLDSQFLPQTQVPQVMPAEQRPGLQRFESAVGSRTVANAQNQGMSQGMGQQFGRMGMAPPATTAPSMEVPSKTGPEGFTFEVTLHKPYGAYLGIDMLPAPELACLMVKQVFQGGVVFAWNCQCEGNAFTIQPGDYIVRVNSVFSDIKAMMEEMRAKSELLVTLMRRRTSDTSRKGGKAFLGGGGSDAGRGLQMPDALSMPSSRLSQLGGASEDLGANYWQQESQSQSLPAGQPFTFQVDIEKPLGRKLGVDVMLVTGPGSCGLLVGQVAPGSYVDQWNQRNQWPLKIQKGDLIVAANGINAWTSLPRMAQEFDVDVQRVCFTVQRSGAAMQSSAPRSSSSVTSPPMQPGMSAMTSPALDAPVENSWWHGMSGMAPGNWVKPLGTSPVPQERPSKSGIQPVQLNVTGRSGYMQSLPAPDVPDDLVMPPGLAARAGQPATIPFEMQSKETSNKMPAKIPEMASAMPREARGTALEVNAAAAAADDAEATATAMAAAVVEDLGLHDDRQEAKSKLPPAKLLLCTLQLGVSLLRLRASPGRQQRFGNSGSS
ncbi:unnamed protein product [Symbiodinium necroappetens]|uniref:PDZ domain-containing protein n=1 Tax=Symbiodinium necroappetens TaxID=1628268 RepID=A0A812MQ71_9DINO|nr:unnamed protein product [Symbiodinium necroappetens]